MHMESCDYLSIVNRKNENKTENKTGKILNSHAFFVISTCVTLLHSCYVKNALLVSQSELSNILFYYVASSVSRQDEANPAL